MSQLLYHHAEFAGRSQLLYHVEMAGMPPPDIMARHHSKAGPMVDHG